MRRVSTLVAAILLSTVLIPGSSAAADWPGFQRDALHTGLAADTDIGDELDEVWSFKLDGGLKGSPVVAEDLVYVGTDAGSVYALGATTGRVVWGPKSMDHPVLGTPAYENNRLYVATSSLDGTKGSLVVLHAKTGDNITSKALGGGSYAGPVIEDGKIFVGTDAGTVIAFETEGMSKLWEFSSAVTIDSKLVPKDETNECCLRSNVKAKPVKTVPISYNERVYFSAFNHLLFAVDSGGNPGAETTSLVWVENVQDIVYSSAAIDTTHKTVVVGSYDGNLYGYDTEPYGFSNSCQNRTFRKYHPVGNDCSTNQDWVYSAGSRIFSSPAVAHGRAYVGDNDGTVHAIDVATGKATWTYKTKGSVFASPAVVNHTIIVGSYDGKLYMFKESTDGKQVGKPFTYTLGGKLHASPAVVNGVVYVGSDDGILYALAEPGSIDIADLALPDITVKSIRFQPDPPVDAERTQVVVTLENLGTADSTSAGLSLYNGASLVDTQQVQLAAGQIKDHTFTLVPVEGNLTVRAVFDEAGALVETLEDNNELSQATTVLPAGSGGSAAASGSDTEEEDSPAIGLVGLLMVLGALAVVARRRD